MKKDLDIIWKDNSASLGGEYGTGSGCALDGFTDNSSEYAGGGSSYKMKKGPVGSVLIPGGGGN